MKSSIRRCCLSLALFAATGLWLSPPSEAASIGYTNPTTGVRIEPREPHDPNKPNGRLCLVNEPCRDLYYPETCFDWAHKREKWYGTCYFLDGYEVVWNPLGTEPTSCFPCNGGGSRATYHSSTFAGIDHAKLDLAVAEDVRCADPGTPCRALPIATLAPDTLSEVAGHEGQESVKVGETDVFLLTFDEALVASVPCLAIAVPF